MPDRVQANPRLDQAVVLHGFPRQGHILEVGLCVYRDLNKYKGPVYYLVLHASASNRMMLKTSHQAFRVGEQLEEKYWATALPNGGQAIRDRLLGSLTDHGNRKPCSWILTVAVEPICPARSHLQFGPFLHAAADSKENYPRPMGRVT